MTDIQLTCAETPLAWPATTKLEDLKTCNTCGLYLLSPQPGTLQVLTRRQGGAGDGVNIQEANSVGADYRGQRYAYDEAIFHTPGLHVFPGETDVYPAEYHIHMQTLSEPKRGLTIVIPVSHKIPTGPGSVYFAATSAQPDPSITPPTLSTILTQGAQVVTYRGPDIRGRTADDPTPDPQCSATYERQFLLVLAPVSIRATDLERIPRIGSLSTDPRDLPAPGVKPSATVPRDRLLMTTVLANPGIAGVIEGLDPLPKSMAGKELECKPVVVRDGQDVVDVSGNTVSLRELLGLGPTATTKLGLTASPLTVAVPKWVVSSLFFTGTLIGLIIADAVFSQLWKYFMSDVDMTWPVIKIWIFIAIAAGGSATAETIMGWFP